MSAGKKQPRAALGGLSIARDPRSSPGWHIMAIPFVPCGPVDPISKENGFGRNAANEDAISELFGRGPIERCEMKIDAAAMVHRKKPSSPLAAVLQQELLEIRPPVVCEGSEIAAEPQTVNNGIEQPPMLQAINFRVGDMVLRARLDLKRRYATQWHGMIFTK